MAMKASSAGVACREYGTRPGQSGFFIGGYSTPGIAKGSRDGMAACSE